MSTPESSSSSKALPPGVRRPLLWLALGSAIGAASIGGYYAGTSSAGPLDTAVRHTLTTWFPDATHVALIVDWGGEPTGALTLAGLLVTVCLAMRRWALALLALAGQGFIGVATVLLKQIFDRTIHGDFLSFPSGHTAGATALAIVMGLLLVDCRRAGPLVGVLTVIGSSAVIGGLAAWAQILLVAHYPTDTLGGFLTALALVPVAALLLDALAGRLTHRRVSSSC